MPDGVSFLITVLFSFGTTLPVFYGNGNSGYNGLSVALNIKPGVYSLGSYGFGACNLSAWFIAISLLS